jgi:hypothetical protein
MSPAIYRDATGRRFSPPAPARGYRNGWSLQRPARLMITQNSCSQCVGPCDLLPKVLLKAPSLPRASSSCGTAYTNTALRVLSRCNMADRHSTLSLDIRQATCHTRRAVRSRLDGNSAPPVSRRSTSARKASSARHMREQHATLHVARRPQYIVRTPQQTHALRQSMQTGDSLGGATQRQPASSGTVNAPGSREAATCMDLRTAHLLDTSHPSHVPQATRDR